MTLRWFGDPVLAGLEKAVMRGVVKGTERLRERMIERVMQPPKSGKLYRRGKGRMHQASAPGESPANDTGNLVRNITTKYDAGKLEGTVNVGTKYGRRLEYGFVGQDAAGRTYDVAPRPFARPSLQETTPEIRQGIVDEITKELNK
ncbi:putative tail component protein [Rhizobium phage RHph_Y52]|nr:putative tail component protein [Rhizobium phage RHph_Y21]QIG76755.1 putative tail component protein [Rhizobium phage RHph_Y52]